MRRGVLLLDSLQEITGRDSKPPSNLCGRANARVAFAALDAADVGHVKLA